MEEKLNLQETLKNKVLHEFTKQFFEFTGNPILLLDLMTKKEMVDGVFHSEVYKSIDDQTAAALLLDENSLDEMYRLYQEFMQEDKKSGKEIAVL